MATNRILEFTPSQEEAVVARILVLVHQAVDEHFPSAEKATRQFTKTVFSDDSERTAIGSLPVLEGFGNEERTDPGHEPAGDEKGSGGTHAPLPAPPSARKDGGSHPVVAPIPPPMRPNHIKSRHESTHQVSRSETSAPSAAPSAESASISAAASTSVTGIERKLNKPDWITRALLALLVAGLLLLAYSVFI